MIPLREMIRLFFDNRGPHRQMEVTTDNLITGLITDKNKWSLFNLAFLLILTCGCIILLINLAIFLIHDVILFQNKLSVNHYGTFIPTKACDCEQAIFMYNTSELWSNTGIQLRKGDKIKISASGAFHSSLSAVEDAARRNSVPTYRWIGSRLRQKARQPFSKRDTAYAFLSSGIADAIDRDTNSYIGAILYQIRPDAQPCRSDWTENKDPGLPDSAFLGIRRVSVSDMFHRVEQNGILYFAINDIYLNNTVINRYETLNRRAVGRITPAVKYGTDSLIDYTNDALKELIRSDSLILYHFIVRGKDTLLSCCGPEFRRHFEAHRAIWYNDNLGQIALSIEIQRQISPSAKNLLLGNKFWYREIETLLFETLNRAQNQRVHLLFVFVIAIAFLAGCLLFTAAMVLLTAMSVYFIIFLFDSFGRIGMSLYRLLVLCIRKMREKIDCKN